MIRLGLAFLLLLSMAPVAVAQEESPPRLRFDPFREPSADEAGVPAAPDRSDTWRPILQAVLVSRDGSMANLGGVVLRPGEEAHGYRLVEVQEFSARFMLGQREVILEVER